jgi:hypothetical protein
VARVRVIGFLLVAFALAGCAHDATGGPSSAASPRDVATRFAAALFRGDAKGARAYLVHPNETALVYLVRRAARPWAGEHASLGLPARHTGTTWTIHYKGTRTHEDGTFERERGDLVVYLASTGAGPAVRYFMFTNVVTRFGTHHDSQLPPSKR